MTDTPVTQLWILDPSLRDLQGHHYEYNRAVIREAHRRGLATTLYAHRDVSPALQAELGAIPYFARTIYEQAALPRLCSGGRAARWAEPWLCNRALARDLARLPAPGHDTLVFAHTVMHRQAVALAHWQRATGARMNLLLRYPPDPAQRRFSAIDFFYRRALAALDSSRAELSTDTERLARAYQQLSGRAVTVLPIPHVPDQPAPPRAATPPYRILQIGHTSTQKGCGLLADLAERWSELPVQLRIQVSARPYGDADFLQHRLPRLLTLPAVSAIHGNLESHAYYAEFADCDAVLAVYDPAVYRGGSSGIFAEAVAFGKPVIASPDSWMADEIHAGRAAGIVLDAYSAESLFEGVRRYTKQAQSLAEQARACSAPWRARHAITTFMDLLLTPDAPRHA